MTINPFKSFIYPKVFFGSAWSSKKVEPLKRFLTIPTPLGKLFLYWCTSPKSNKVFNEKYKIKVIKELFKEFDLRIEECSMKGAEKENTTYVTDEDLNDGFYIRDAIGKYDSSTYFFMHSAYSKVDGSYVGTWEDAWKYQNRFGITKIQKSKPDHKVSSIGFNEKENKWYGWSHRAIHGFGIQSESLEFFPDEEDKKPIWIACTLEDAKQMAIDFAESVS
jgi:hypothetical protein